MWRLTCHLTVNPITNYGNRMTRIAAHAVQGNPTSLPDVRNVIAVASGKGGAVRGTK
jgi:Mrp family chromosome partitioning ATPase